MYWIASGKQITQQPHYVKYYFLEHYNLCRIRRSAQCTTAIHHCSTSLCVSAPRLEELLLSNYYLKLFFQSRHAGSLYIIHRSYTIEPCNVAHEKTTLRPNTEAWHIFGVIKGKKLQMIVTQQSATLAEMANVGKSTVWFTAARARLQS